MVHCGKLRMKSTTSENMIALYQLNGHHELIQTID